VVAPTLSVTERRPMVSDFQNPVAGFGVTFKAMFKKVG
jgi:hypothetical protein